MVFIITAIFTKTTFRNIFSLVFCPSWLRVQTVGGLDQNSFGLGSWIALIDKHLVHFALIMNSWRGFQRRESLGLVSCPTIWSLYWPLALCINILIISILSTERLGTSPGQAFQKWGLHFIQLQPVLKNISAFQWPNFFVSIVARICQFSLGSRAFLTLTKHKSRA